MAAEKYLSENYNWFFDEFDITELQDIIQAMEDYSKEQLLLHNVSQQRELLIAFAKYMEEDKMYARHDEANVDDFLENYSN